MSTLTSEEGRLTCCWLPRISFKPQSQSMKRMKFWNALTFPRKGFCNGGELPMSFSTKNHSRLTRYFIGFYLTHAFCVASLGSNYGMHLPVTSFSLSLSSYLCPIANNLSSLPIIPTSSNRTEQSSTIRCFLQKIVPIMAVNSSSNSLADPVLLETIDKLFQHNIGEYVSLPQVGP